MRAPGTAPVPLLAPSLAALTAFSLLLAAPPFAAALDIGARMPELGLTDLATGKRVDAASLAGKVVVIDFWATWCAPCKQELPRLDALYKKYKSQGLVVVAVSVDSDVDKAKTLARELKLTFPIVHDAQHKAAEHFDPPKMPSSFIIDRNGLVRHLHAGFRVGDEVAIERELRELLDAPANHARSASR